ncbi:MAG: beta-ketoacyl-[acyl-carrier-protein] synthase family protein [Flavobacteriales bacterium]
MRVFVTGFGVISAIGEKVEENLNNLRQGRTGIGKAHYLDSRYSEFLPFGEVKRSNEELYQKLDLQRKGVPRTELLAYTAFQEAIEHAGLSSDQLHSWDTSLVSATTVGGMSNMQALYNDAKGIDEGSPYHDTYSNGMHTQRLAEEYAIKGLTCTINTACSASANAIMVGTRMIRTGRSKRVLVGGTDSLAKFTVNGFNALQVLSEEMCRPFDENREGLNLGEGAAYLVLEAEDACREKRRYCEVLGYGNSNDAFHPSSLSEEAIGVTAAMEKALSTAGTVPSEIDHINAHGTATENNDWVESNGLKKVFGEKVPSYNSTKSYTGHTLAAAGAIEAVYSILSLYDQELYPSLNCTHPISSFPMEPIRAYEAGTSIEKVMSNSFGFAGNCTSVVLGKA